MELMVKDIGVLAAGADLSSKQFYFVQISAEDTCNLAGAADESTIGILQNEPESGQAASIRTMGISMLVLGDTVSVDDQLTPDADGKGVPATTGEKYLCRALQAGSAGESISVLMEINRVA